MRAFTLNINNKLIKNYNKKLKKKQISFSSFISLYKLLQSVTTVIFSNTYDN